MVTRAELCTKVNHLYVLHNIYIELTRAQLRLRNLRQHLRYCDLLDTDDSATFSVEYGVNRLRLLNEVPNFDLFAT